MDWKIDLLVPLLLVEMNSLAKEEEEEEEDGGEEKERKQRWRERRGRKAVRWMDEVK